MVRWAAVGGEWPSAVRDEVIASAATDEERTQLHALAAHAQFSDSTSETFARALLSAHEDAAAFALAQAGSELPLGERAGVLVQAAVRLDDPTRLAEAAAGGLTQRSAAHRRCDCSFPTALAERIASYPRPAVPVDSWATWLNAIYEDPEWSNAIKIADDQGDAWTESLAHDQDSLVEQAADRRGARGERTRSEMVCCPGSCEPLFRRGRNGWKPYGLGVAYSQGLALCRSPRILHQAWQTLTRSQRHPFRRSPQKLQAGAG